MIKLSIQRLTPLLSMLALLCWTTPLIAQFTENFEDDVVGSNTFMSGGVAFSTTDPLDINSFANGGSNGAGDNQFLEANGTGNVGKVTILTAGNVFQMHSIDVWLSADAGATTSAGTLTFRGVLAAGGTQEVVFTTMPADANDWLEFSFAGTALAGAELAELEFIIDGSKNYLALDDFEFSSFNPNAVNISVNDVTMAEGDVGSTAFNFMLTRSNNNTDFSLTVATANETALAGSDYEAIAPTSLSFTAGGALSQMVNVNVFGDVNVENTETFTLNLSDPTNGAVLIDAQGLGTITDDDTICETFEDETGGSQSFSEFGVSFSTTGALAVASFTGGGSSNSDLFLDTGAGDGPTNGSAGEIVLTTANRAFELFQVDLWPSADDGNNRAAGEVTFIGTKLDLTTVSHTFNVAANSSFGWEEELTFVGTPLDGIQLSKVEVLLGEGLNYLAIDDLKFAEFDNEQVLVSIDDVSLVEGDAGTSEFVFTVTRTNNTTAFAVTAATAMGGSSNPATSGIDYVSLTPTVLNFTAGGALTQTVTVVVNGDIESEFPETFLLDLSGATNGAIISDGEGLGTILDDDTTCETFEDEGMADLMAFSEDGLSFTTSGHLQTGFFASGGSTGSDYYLESDADGVPYVLGSSVGTMQLTTAETGFELLRLDLWLSNDDDINTAEIDQLRLVGTPQDGSPAVSVDITSTNPGNWSENISLAGTDFDGLVLSAVELILQGTSNYVAIDNICLVEVPICDPVSFVAPADLCLEPRVRSDLSGGLPAGGVYSGPGVRDGVNGMTYAFNIQEAGAGVHTITYTYTDARGCSGVATDEIEVFALPEVTFTPSVMTVDPAGGIQTGISGGTPTGGTYSGTGVTDDGNGMSFSLDPSTLLPGSITFIRYTYTDANGCTDFAENTINIAGQMLPADECEDAADLSALFGQPFEVPQTSDIWDNTAYTTSEADPTTGYECFQEPFDSSAPSLERTIWYSFTGDGNRYRIRTVRCEADSALYANDTQIAVYSGDCGNLSPVVCGEDEDTENLIYNADVELETEMGATYVMMIDGFGPDFESFGQYCVEVTNLTTVSTTALSVSNLEIFPNPTNGLLQFAQETVSKVEVFDAQGRWLITRQLQEQKLDLSSLPSGLYVLRLHTPAGLVRAKVIKE